MKKILFLLVLATSTMADEPKPEIQPSSFPFQGETKAETVSNKLEQTVISFLDATQEAGSKLSNAADKAISFATGEIPLVIKEYLNWHFAISLAWFFIGVAVLLAALYFFYRVIYKNRDLPWATKDGYLTEQGNAFLFSSIGSIALSLISILIMGFNLTWMKILVAPRVFLMDQFQHLLK